MSKNNSNLVKFYFSSHENVTQELNSARQTQIWSIGKKSRIYLWTERWLLNIPSKAYVFVNEIKQSGLKIF